MEPDELLDIQEQANVVGKLTPIEFAKLYHRTPQYIYYLIRNKKIELEYCACGRRVIDVNKASEVLEAQAIKRREKLDTRHDAARPEGQGSTVSGLSQTDLVEGSLDRV